MAHHGMSMEEFDPNELERLLKGMNVEKAPRTMLGATGKFPHGQLTQQDQGEIALGITTKDGKVVLTFGEKPITWVGFTPEQARTIAECLIKRANEADR